ncbi:MAG: aminoglycoside phosphotransferase family protein [Legionellales bacterium]|nr:aminoglycoside phosphotransferase family protein [Legionellales bacterium]
MTERNRIDDGEELHVQWAIHTLKEKGYRIQDTIPETIQCTPWSEVCCFITDQGSIYLKKVPSALSLESEVIKILHEKFHANVPQIIAINQKQNCFLMLDSGVQLYDFFKQGFNAEILIQAMQDYTAVQIMTIGKIDLFLAIGVPDWRLDKLPILYPQLIAQDKLLMNDGITKDELKKLEKLDVQLFSICSQLSNYKIPETLSHCDFHDKNILVNTHTYQTTMIDLGEVAISHPFFSFHNCLYRAKENFALTGKEYQQLQEKCFEPWLNLESRAHLFEILLIIEQCWSIHAVLGEYRLIESVDLVSFQALSRQGRLAEKLRYWLKQY